MKKFTLPKSGGAATIDILAETDLDDVIELHDWTRANLPPDKKQFILPHGTTYFEDLLSQKTGLMIGIRTGGLLIAQIALKGPMGLDDAINDQVITHNDVTFYHASLNDTVVVIKSLASHPEWRGNELAKTLVNYAVEIPFTKDCDHMFAQISAANKHSWDIFLSQGFGLVAAGYDPDDELPRFIIQRPKEGFNVELADITDLENDFPAIVRLTRDEAVVFGRGE